jgi:hypothetical protein
MATKQTSSGSDTRKGQGARSSAGTRGAAQTGERDEHYNVISVLYHALQGADTIAKYIEDARSARDQELLAFFEETRAEYAERAQRAKQMLATRLEGTDPGLDEDEDGADEDSDDDDED